MYITVRALPTPRHGASVGGDAQEAAPDGAADEDPRFLRPRPPHGHRGAQVVPIGVQAQARTLAYQL